MILISLCRPLTWTRARRRSSICKPWTRRRRSSSRQVKSKCHHRCAQTSSTCPACGSWHYREWQAYRSWPRWVPVCCTPCECWAHTARRPFRCMTYFVPQPSHGSNMRRQHGRECAQLPTAHLDLLLRRAKGLGYSSDDVPAAADLFNSADDDFSPQTNSNHVLQPYLPEKIVRLTYRTSCAPALTTCLWLIRQNS